MVILLLTGILLLTIIIYLLWCWRRHHIEKLAACIPGPFRWPLIGNALELGWNTVDLYQNLSRLCQLYGPLFRVWLGPELFIVLLNPKDLEIILSNSKYINKAMVYNFFHPWLGTGLLTSSGEKWHKHRKLITPTFHFKILDLFMDAFNKKGDILIQKLQKEVDGQSFDVYSYSTLYSLDVITETAMGLNINAQTEVKSPYVNAVKKQGEIIMERCIKPWLYPDLIFNMTSYGRNQRKALEVLHTTTQVVIQNKKKELASQIKSADTITEEYKTNMRKKKHVAFLDLLLEENLRSESFSDKDLQEEVDTFMFEGHDTSASALAFTLWLLSTHHNIQDKAYDEVERLLSQTSNNIPTLQVLNEMKYLECVIKESLRLYPSVPIIAREIKEDILVTGDIKLPAQSNLVIPTYIVHRNPDMYPQPEAFIPERFLSVNNQSGNPFAYIPFSAGSRNCIGQKFAMLAMKTSISKILLQYKLLPDYEFKPILSAEAILKSTNGIKMKISSRKSEPN